MPRELQRRAQNGGWGSHILSALARPPPQVPEPNLPHTPSLILRMASQQLQLAAQAPNASFRNRVLDGSPTMALGVPANDRRTSPGNTEGPQ